MRARASAAADAYASDWRTFAAVTAGGVLMVHLMTVAAYAMLLNGFGVAYPLWTVVTAVTVGNIVGLLPIFPAGIGGRDLAVVAILEAGGVAFGDARVAQLLYTAMILFFNLAGGIFFVIDPGRKSAARNAARRKAD